MSAHKDILAGLNPRQVEAVTATEGPLLVIAGAGSGKTKALTHRIAYLIAEKGVAPYQILAVTFTNKAAGEIKERVAKLLGVKNAGPAWREPFGAVGARLPTMGTFHSVCVRILRKYAHLLDYEDSFTIYDANDQQILMKQLMAEHHLADSKMNPKAILGTISGAKAQLIGPAEYLQFADSAFTEKVGMLYGPYQASLRRNGAMDFDDLLVNVVRLLREVPEVCAALQAQFRYIMVDEYQDTNHVQYVLTKLLGEKSRNVCVIGDDDQSIYSWRGATVRNILDFEKDYPEAQTVVLDQNYRSTQNILDAAHAVISQNRQRKDKKLWTEQAGGEKIQVRLARNERHEAELVAEEIMRELRGHESPSYQDFVVLYRTNAQSRVMEEMLLRYGIPYRIVGGIKFYDRKEIKDVIAYLKVVVNPSDSVSLLRVLNVPARGVGSRTIEIVQEHAARRGVGLFEMMERAEELDELAPSKREALLGFVRLIHGLQKANMECNASGVIKHVLEDAGYRTFLDDGSSEGEERLENVRELISVANKYDALEAGMSVRVFLEEVALIADTDSLEQGENVVTLMTIHSAKGLEFPTVFVVGLEEGLLPHGNSFFEPGQLEEERRLMYVAVTRAKERLFLLHTQERLLYGEYRSNAPSQFLELMPDEVCERNYRMEGEGSRKTSGSGVGDSVRRVPMDDVYLDDYDERRIAVNDERGYRRVVKKIPFEEVADGGLHDGDRVEHPMFGCGVVVKVTGGVVTVTFEDAGVGTKKLAISVAPLKKI